MAKWLILPMIFNIYQLQVITDNLVCVKERKGEGHDRGVCVAAQPPGRVRGPAFFSPRTTPKCNCHITSSPNAAGGSVFPAAAAAEAPPLSVAPPRPSATTAAAGDDDCPTCSC